MPAVFGHHQTCRTLYNPSNTTSLIGSRGLVTLGLNSCLISPRFSSSPASSSQIVVGAPSSWTLPLRWPHLTSSIHNARGTTSHSSCNKLHPETGRINRLYILAAVEKRYHSMKFATSLQRRRDPAYLRTVPFDVPGFAATDIEENLNSPMVGKAGGKKVFNEERKGLDPDISFKMTKPVSSSPKNQ